MFALKVAHAFQYLMSVESKKVFRILAVERSETANYFYRIQQVHCWRQVLGVQNHDFGMDSVIPSNFHSTFLALCSSIFTIYVQIFVSERVFLPNESSVKRLATCINIFSIEYHNFYVQKCSVFVPSFRSPLSYLCSLAGCPKSHVKLVGWYPSQ